MMEKSYYFLTPNKINLLEPIKIFMLKNTGNKIQMRTISCKNRLFHIHIGIIHTAAYRMNQTVRYV